MDAKRTLYYFNLHGRHRRLITITHALVCFFVPLGGSMAIIYNDTIVQLRE